MNSYSMKRLGAELILKLEEQDYSPEYIAEWADNIRHKHLKELDVVCTQVLQDLSAMTFGEEFKMSKEEVEDLAVSLILKKHQV